MTHHPTHTGLWVLKVRVNSFGTKNLDGVCMFKNDSNYLTWYRNNTKLLHNERKCEKNPTTKKEAL